MKTDKLQHISCSRTSRLKSFLNILKKHHEYFEAGRNHTSNEQISFDEATFASEESYFGPREQSTFSLIESFIIDNISFCSREVVLLHPLGKITWFRFFPVIFFSHFSRYMDGFTFCNKFLLQKQIYDWIGKSNEL